MITWLNLRHEYYFACFKVSWTYYYIYDMKQYGKKKKKNL